MATALRTSLEEYLRSHYEPECELIDGELFPKPMGTPEHGRMQKRLLRILERYEAKGIGEVLPELSVRHEQDVRIPDVAFTTVVQAPGEIVSHPPLLCVEILSPSQRPSELFSKCEAYHAWGVPYCWVIDPIKKLAWEYHREAPVQLASVSLGAGEISVTLAELFE